ncbi:MAG TPA: diguanylate cyclase, partial [Erythrobacter sp.]|nr:diguanylate cyclase [Erythrobacter sp.]
MTKRHLPPLAAPLIPLALLLGVAGLIAPSDGEIAGFFPAAVAVAAVLLYAGSIFYLGRILRDRRSDMADEGATDSLSLLPNRRALHTDIDHHHVADEEIALALVDLDSFKQVNDHYGH